jgi:hypothetical protein
MSSRAAVTKGKEKEEVRVMVVIKSIEGVGEFGHQDMI